MWQKVRYRLDEAASGKSFPDMYNKNSIRVNREVLSSSLCITRDITKTNFGSGGSSFFELHNTCVVGKEAALHPKSRLRRLWITPEGSNLSSLSRKCFDLNNQVLRHVDGAVVWFMLSVASKVAGGGNIFLWTFEMTWWTSRQSSWWQRWNWQLVVGDRHQWGSYSFISWTVSNTGVNCSTACFPAQWTRRGAVLCGRIRQRQRMN